MITIIILSGGAVGADELFGSFNHTCFAFSFEGHTACNPKEGAVVKVPQDHLDMRETELKRVCKVLGKNYPKKHFIKNLLLRNMFQISNKKYRTSLVIAIGSIAWNNREVEGGTGYAVAKAIIEKISLVIVLNKDDNLFYYYDYAQDFFVKLSEIINLNDYEVMTGIGSRQISEGQIKIIQNVFKTMSIENK